VLSDIDDTLFDPFNSAYHLLELLDVKLRLVEFKGSG
jgi:hypothetical protein